MICLRGTEQAKQLKVNALHWYHQRICCLSEVNTPIQNNCGSQRQVRPWSSSSSSSSQESISETTLSTYAKHRIRSLTKSRKWLLRCSCHMLSANEYLKCCWGLPHWRLLLVQTSPSSSKMLLKIGLRLDVNLMFTGYTVALVGSIIHSSQVKSLLCILSVCGTVQHALQMHVDPAYHTFASVTPLSFRMLVSLSQVPDWPITCDSAASTNKSLNVLWCWLGEIGRTSPSASPRSDLEWNKCQGIVMSTGTCLKEPKRAYQRSNGVNLPWWLHLALANDMSRRIMLQIGMSGHCCSPGRLCNSGCLLFRGLWSRIQMLPFSSLLQLGLTHHGCPNAWNCTFGLLICL